MGNSVLTCTCGLGWWESMGDHPSTQTPSLCVSPITGVQTMEQAAREVAHDTVAATQAVMAEYQAELDAARREDEAVAQKVGLLSGVVKH